MGVCKIILVYRRAQDMWLCVQLYISIWNNTSNNKIKHFDNCVCYFSLKIQTYCQNKNLTYRKLSSYHLSMLKTSH